MKFSYTYLISNYTRTVIYTGVTNDIERRILEHKAGVGSKFSSKYKCVDLMYFEEHNNIEYAIEREKEIKNKHSKWKWNLVKKENPYLKDLAADWNNDVDLQDIRDEHEIYRK